MSTGDRQEPTIDTTLVHRLLLSQFPQWADLPLSPVPTPGMDNATFRLGDDKSVRLPRYARWVGQVEREHRWLPRLAPLLPFPSSEPLAKGEPGEGYPFPWSVYRWLEGERATADGLADATRAATELAAYIKALQWIDATGGPGPQWSNAYRGVPLGDERDSIATQARVLPKIAGLGDSGLLDVDGVVAVWEAALAAPAWQGEPVWFHGDLAPGNLLMTDGQLSGVIDFGTLGVGDPAVDLLPAWLFLPPEVRGVFRDAMEVDDATWARGRGWALASSLPVPDDPYFHRHPQRVSTALDQLGELVGDL
ncbi:aminoglycoside phosphotransferase family protein [Streptomyces albipurpureus]|uniref:Aminoglycoside phosphotransferase family protein n=1 Tax=Streptomyces albipurpureus TaxID=2897419 RepID=A0ABT0UMP2_9ACTN|nr:aminoglycoside phosphotransferase family protein [Streptomyces sp. CWNU-1]MCM2389274.1 aminoglycoside phosphotransferase family protein [Streptomyces sp. CWNU-1]